MLRWSGSLPRIGRLLCHQRARSIRSSTIGICSRLAASSSSKPTPERITIGSRPLRGGFFFGGGSWPCCSAKAAYDVGRSTTEVFGLKRRQSPPARTADSRPTNRAPTFLLDEASVLERAGCMLEARLAYQNVLRRDHNNVAASMALGRIALQGQQPHLAVPHFQKR